MEKMLISIWVAFLGMLALAIWFQKRARKIGRNRKKETIQPFNLKVEVLLKRAFYFRSLILRYEHSLKQLTRLGEEERRSRAGDFFRKTVLLFLAIFAVLALLKVDSLYFIVYALTATILLEVFLDYILVKRHNALLTGQIQFNELVRQKYHEQGMIEEAIYEACQEFPEKENPMLIQGELIYDVLTESNVEEAVQLYNHRAPNKYLKMLLNLCYITAEYGDSLDNGQSVFMKSLSHLTNEIRVEEMKRSRLNYSLKSLHFIVILPLLFMKPLQNWSVQSFEPLKIFYQSRWGRLTEFFMFFLILSVAMVLRKIQNIGILPEENLTLKSRKQLFYRKWRVRKITFLFGIACLTIWQWREISYFIPLWQVFFVFLFAWLMGYEEAVARFFVERVKEMEREDEVAGYRSILLMLMYHSRMGMEEILSWLSMFSDYYRERFSRCINQFTMGTEIAFAELKKESQPDFQSLVFQLEAASGDLSLQQAFDDLVHEKAYYLERRKEINRQMVEKRLAMGQIIGFLPAYALIIFYLIIPMIYSGMQSMNQFYQSI